MALIELEPDASAAISFAELMAMNDRPRWLLDAPPMADGLPYGVALLRVPTPQHARELLAPADPAERRRRSAVFHKPRSYRARARLPIGQHDRMEEYLLADGSICAADKAGHDRHFPIHLKSVRLRELRLEIGEVAELSSFGSIDWPWLHYNEELYLRVQIDRLIVAPGAALHWAGNIASVQIGAVIAATPVTAQAPFAIRIGGTAHHAYSRLRRSAASAGTPGEHGRNGCDGTLAQVRHTPFGPRAAGVDPTAGMHGEAGSGGTDGSTGGQGRSGGMVMFAGIELLKVRGIGTGGLLLDVQAGAGEPGGRGGDGGAGGTGGCGAPGWIHPSGANLAGHGGEGGAGGNGGDGGRGGAGGLASHIFVSLPEKVADAVTLRARAADGGAPGAGGCAGAGGRGGSGGAGLRRPFVAPDPDGSAGRDGAPGRPGRAGAAGRPGEVPPVWIHHPTN